MKKALLCGVSLLLCIGLITGCDNASKKTEPGIVENTDPIPATGISLSVGRTEYSNGSSYTLGIGEDNGRYIYANLEPADSTSYVYWETSDTSLLNIEVFPNTHSIFLTALYDEESWGEDEESKNATLTATTEEGYSASLNIVVNKPLGTSTTKTNTTVRVFFTNSGHTTYYALPDYTGQEEEWPEDCHEGCFTTTSGSLTYWYQDSDGEWTTLSAGKLTEGVTESQTPCYDVTVGELEVGVDYGALVALKFDSSITTEFNTNDYSFSVSQYDVADDGGVVELYVTQNPANIIQPFAPINMTLNIYFKDSAGTSYALPEYAYAYLTGDFSSWVTSGNTGNLLTLAGTEENPYYTITLEDMTATEQEFAVYLETTNSGTISWAHQYGSNFTLTPSSGNVTVELVDGDPADHVHDPNATCSITFAVENTNATYTSGLELYVSGATGFNNWTAASMTAGTNNQSYTYTLSNATAYDDFTYCVFEQNNVSSQSWKDWCKIVPTTLPTGFAIDDNNIVIPGDILEQDATVTVTISLDFEAAATALASGNYEGGEVTYEVTAAA